MHDPLPGRRSPSARSATRAASRSRRTPTPTTSSSAGWTTAPTATASRPRRAEGGRAAAATPRCRRPAAASPSTRTTPGYQTFVDEHPAVPAAVLRVRHLPRLAAGRLLPDLRRSTTSSSAFNFAQAAGFVVPTPTAVEQSEILLRPLTPRAGGVSHTGGVFFKSRDDDIWKTLRRLGGAGPGDPPLGTVVKTAGEDFFEANVMPEAAPARLRAGGLPQPRRVQRLPPALGRQRLLRADARCGATTRRLLTSSWRSTPPTSGSRAR